MARVKPLGVDDLPPQHQAAYRTLMADFAEFSNQIPVYANSPEGMTHLFALVTALKETGNLTLREREIAITAASHANRCPYCVAHHATRLTESGLTPEAVDNLLAPVPPGLDEKEIAIRDYAVAVTERAWGIRDELVDRLKRHFNDTQITELTLRIALAGLFNKVNQALGLELEEDHFAHYLAEGLGADALQKTRAVDR